MPQTSNSESFYVSLSGNGILPSQFLIPGLHLHSHISPAFSSKQVPLTAPAQTSATLMPMQHPMIQFPPHLLEPTANFSITFSKSHIPKSNKPHFPSIYEPKSPAKQRKPVLTLPLGSVCFLLHISLSPHLPMLRASSPHPGTPLRPAAAWVFASLLQPKPRLCSLP